VQLALSATRPPQVPSPSRRTRQTAGTAVKKGLVTGVAVATAGVLAVAPVTPPLPDVPERAERALQLTAFANPITPWTNLVANLFNNLGTQTTESTEALVALAEALTNPTVYAELTELAAGNLLNPLPLINQLLGFQDKYGADISERNAQSVSALITSLSRLPIVLTNTANFLAAGEFVEAYAELDIWFLVNLLEQPARPLFPLFALPGEIAEQLPGGARLATIFDTVLNRSGATGITKALLVAPITATLALAENLDWAREAFENGDAETGVGLLTALPATVLNAFLNGYSPDFEVRSTFPGIFGEGGPVDYFTRILPSTIAAALTTPTTTTTTTATTTTTTTPASITQGAATDTQVDRPTIALNVSGTPAALAGGSGAGARTTSETPRTETSLITEGRQEEEANGPVGGTDGNTTSDPGGDTGTNNAAGEGNSTTSESGGEATGTGNTGGGAEGTDGAQGGSEGGAEGGDG